MKAILLCALIMGSATAWAGWRHDCRQAGQLCRQSKGDSLTTTTSTTTTTLPAITLTPYTGFVSQNCGSTPQGCVAVQGPLALDGHILCPPLATMTVCSFPVPPAPVVTPIQGTDCLFVLAAGIPPGRYCPSSSSPSP